MYKSIFSQTGQSFVEEIADDNVSVAESSTGGMRKSQIEKRTRMRQIDKNLKASPFVKAS